MADYTPNKKLELPKSVEKYDVGVANKNNMVIDSELHKLELKNQSQDELLATKENLNSEIARSTNRENEINQKLDAEISRAKSSENELVNSIENEINRAVNAEENITNELDNYLPIDGTAKNSEKLAGYEITKVSSKIWGSIPRIDASGVMEVGKYIDFHDSADDFSDFYIRVTARDGGLYIGDKKIVVAGEALPITGGTLENNTATLLVLKRADGNFARIDFENLSGHLFSIEGYSAEDGTGKQLNVFARDWNKSLLRINEKSRVVYDYKTNAEKELVVSGEALPITGGKLTDNKEMILTLNNTSENATQTSLCFQHNTISAGLIIVDNDGSIHYWDYVHGKTLFWIGVNRREIYDSASNSRKKIMVDGDVSHFQVGETFRIKGDTPLAGYVTTGATAIYFTIPLPKSAEGRTVKISCNPWRVRGVQGYIVNQVNMDDYSVATEISGNLLKLQVGKKDLTAFDNAVNNTPVGVDGKFTIEFS